MKIYTLHPKLNKLNYYIAPEQNLPDEVLKLKKRICQCSELLKNKVPWGIIKEVVGISRSNYYRLRNLVKKHGLLGLVKRSKRPRNVRKSKIPQVFIDKILLIRKDNPTYGKAKIAVILLRDFIIKLSESSVGRVIKKLMLAGKIKRSFSAWRTCKKRNFTNHAKRWEYGKNIPKQPGEMVQVDHMTVTKNNCSLKHFQAWDPINKYIDADVASNATSSAARKFLLKLIKESPFKISSIHVDGGSEFMADFELGCKELDIAYWPRL